ncbi:unnamed protein product [Moneuplotes crassus]|uniref:Uncharacterized protein n=1 Tax=Euplotes crassus TaxID=5936 RepID=A0AAD2D7U5_EUPCR|nr:unnamed protein product [Moneuplotes crassus]
MGEKAFLALVDVIEEEKGVQALKLQGNNLTDKCVIALCRMLEDVHHKDLEYLDLSENPSLTDETASALASLVTRLPNLAQVRLQECPRVSKQKMNVLELKVDEKILNA